LQLKQFCWEKEKKKINSHACHPSVASRHGGVVPALVTYAASLIRLPWNQRLVNFIPRWLLLPLLSSLNTERGFDLSIVWLFVICDGDFLRTTMMWLSNCFLFFVLLLLVNLIEIFSWVLIWARAETFLTRLINCVVFR
jgi:hypothetical protein